MSKFSFVLLSALLSASLSACGDDDDDATTDGGTSGDGSATVDAAPTVDARVADAAPLIDAATTFSLSSTALAPGATFMAAHTCAGTNVSPPLSWTAGPAGTMSYAVVFQDLSNMLRHWVIWDIPASTTSLPMAVANMDLPANVSGAKQVRSYDDQTYGYLGPCPSGQLHNYRFTVFALDVATLTNLNTATSTMTQVHTRIQASDLATATLTGMSAARRP